MTRGKESPFYTHLDSLGPSLATRFFLFLDINLHSLLKGNTFQEAISMESSGDTSHLQARSQDSKLKGPRVPEGQNARLQVSPLGPHHTPWAAGIFLSIFRMCTIHPRACQYS